MCVTICGRFCSDEGVVAGYDNRIRAKYTAKWGMQIAGMIFQTRSKPLYAIIYISVLVYCPKICCTQSITPCFLLYFLQYIISIYNNLIIQITVQYVQHQPHGYSSDIHSLFLQIWKCKKHSSLSPLPVLRT